MKQLLTTHKRKFLIGSGAVCAAALMMVFGSEAPTQELQTSIIRNAQVNKATPQTAPTTDDTAGDFFEIETPKGIEAVYDSTIGMLSLNFSDEYQFFDPTTNTTATIAPGTQTQIPMDGIEGEILPDFFTPTPDTEVVEQEDFWGQLSFGNQYHTMVFSQPVAFTMLGLPPIVQEVGVASMISGTTTDDQTSKCNLDGTSNNPTNVFEAERQNLTFYSCTGGTFILLAETVATNEDDLGFWLKADTGLSTDLAGNTPAYEGDTALVWHNNSASANGDILLEATPVLLTTNTDLNRNPMPQALFTGEILDIEQYLTPRYHAFIVDKDGIHQWVQVDGEELVYSKNNTVFEIADTKPVLSDTVQEIMLYTKELDETQRNEITSYLSVKYGIMLEDTVIQIGETVMYDPENTDQWTNDMRSMTSNNKFNLTQQKIMTPSMTMNALSPLKNNATLTIAHNGADLSVVEQAEQNKLERVWQISGNAPETEAAIRFPISELSGASTVDLQLIIAGDENMQENTRTHAGILNNDMLVFAPIQIMPGQYFTLASSMPTIAIVEAMAGEEGGKNPEFVVTVSNNDENKKIDFTYRVHYDGVESVQSDFIAAGETTAYIQIPVANDQVQNGERTVSVRLLQATNANISASKAAYQIEVSDDDTTGIKHQILDRTTSEDGDTAQIAFTLTSKPNAAVEIHVRAEDPTEGETMQNIVIIQAENWNTPQENILEVKGLDDNRTDNDTTYHITITEVTSDDQAYNEMDVKNIENRIQLVNEDNDNKVEEEIIIEEISEEVIEAPEVIHMDGKVLRKAVPTPMPVTNETPTFTIQQKETIYIPKTKNKVRRSHRSFTDISDPAKIRELKRR